MPTLVNIFDFWKKLANGTAPLRRQNDYHRQFKRKECVRFEADTNNERHENVCFCGLPYTDHLTHDEIIPDGRPQQSPFLGPWDPEKCTREFETDAYGTLSFRNETMGSFKPARYLRISEDAWILMNNGGNTPTVLELLAEYWDIMKPIPPRLVISVAGDIENTNLDDKIKEAFTTGLIKAVQSADALLITDGMDAGVTHIVGESVNEEQSIVEVEGVMVPKIRCLGVAAFGSVRHNVNLINSGDIIVYREEHDESTKLNGNHTHFLLVDDGMVNPTLNLKNTNKFRARLEEAIQRPAPEGLEIPVVLIIVGGGVATVNKCQQALKRRIPVLILNDTGGASSFLAHVISKYCPDPTADRPTVDADNLQESLMSDIPNFFSGLSPDELKICADDAKQCCNPEMVRLITFFDIKVESTMDKFILYALLTGRASLEGQLKVALQWNRVDIAEDKIFKQHPKWSTDEVSNIMKEALLEQKIDFVKLLLKKKFKIGEYLTIGNLRFLYNTSPPSSHLRKLLKKPDSEIYLADIDALLDNFVGKYENAGFTQDTGEDDDILKCILKEPYNELLVWAILTKRDDLAEYIWEKCKAPLSAATVASCLYQELRYSTSIRHTEQRRGYLNQKKEFECKAVEVVDVYYREDNENAMKLVEGVMPEWGQVHTLDLALMAKNRQFVSTPCCQAIVDRRWNDIKKRFWGRFLFRFLLLILHSGVVLFNMGYTPSAMEVLTGILVIFDFIEKVSEARGEKLRKIWKAAWNYYDLSYQLLFVVGFIFRCFPETYSGGKIIYSFVAAMFWIRLLRMGYVYNRLGPNILIFIFMMPKLMVFIALLMAFVFGYGTAFKALMHHPCENRAVFFSDIWNSTEFLQGIIFTPYWMMFGELQLDTFQNANWVVCYPTNNSWGWISECNTCQPDGPDDPYCACTSATDYVVAVRFILAGYLILGNVLLLNLVIAIFSNVFNYVQKKSIEHWKFEMYRLIREYERKPPLPPPIGTLISIGRMLLNWYKKRMEKTKNSALKSRDLKNAMLRLFERQCFRMYLAEKEAQRTTIEDKILYTLNEMNEKMSQRSSTGLRPEDATGLGTSAAVRWGDSERREPHEGQLSDLEFVTQTRNAIMRSLDHMLDLRRIIDLLHHNLRDSQARLERSQELQVHILTSVQETQRMLVSDLRRLMDKLSNS